MHVADEVVVEHAVPSEVDGLRWLALLALELADASDVDRVHEVVAQHLPHVLRADAIVIADIDGVMSVVVANRLGSDLADLLARASHGPRVLRAPLDGPAGPGGQLLVAAMPGHRYGAAAAEHLGRAARLVAAALERIELHVRLEQAEDMARACADRQLVISDMSHGLAAAMTQAEVFDAVADAVARVVDCDRVSFAELVGDGDRLRVASLRGADSLAAAGTFMPAAGTQVGQVARTGRSILDVDLATAVDVDAQTMARLGMRSSLLVPVSARGDVIGSLNVASAEPDGFDESDRDLLVLLGQMMGSTLDRVHALVDVHHDALHDELTGLLNRRGLDRAFRAQLGGHEGPTAVCFVDLDHLKPVNDVSGHAAGDALLVHVAGRLRHALPEHDVVARVGGDEFVIVLRRCDLTAARAVAERLRRRVGGAPFVWNERSFAVSASIGVVEVGAGEDLADVLVRADAACYAAKATGRDRVCVQLGPPAEVG